MKSSMKPIMWISVGALPSLALVLWFLAFKGAPKTPTKLHEYCTAVAVSIERDVKDFESESIKAQQEAASRFGEQVTFHSAYEIQLCAAHPVNLEQRPLCAIGPDPTCLAKLARESARAIRDAL